MSNNSNNCYQVVVGGAIVTIIVGLYLYTFILVLLEVFCHAPNPLPEEIPQGIRYILTSTGSLFSALVIAKLAISVPGTDPGIIKIKDKKSDFATIITWVYLGTWVVAGLFALILGIIIYPDVSQVLCDMGTAWFGLVIAAGYSYFAIEP